MEDVPAWASVLAGLPPDRRDRVVIPWETGSSRAVREMARAARDGGVTRIRVERTRGGAPSDREVAALVRCGVNEVAFDAADAPEADLVAALRARAALAHSVLIVPVPGRRNDVPGGWRTDEIEIRVDADWLVADPEEPAKRVDALVAGSADWFRLVSVRGLALCRIPSLDPGRVVSNALELWVPDDVLQLKFEDPGRVFFDECRRCRLSLACDGFSRLEFCRSEGPRVLVRPFEGGGARVVTLDAHGLGHRDHPPTWITGRVPLMAVAEGVRPAGRVAVAPSDLPDQLALIREAGLCAEVVETTPPDTDHAQSGEVHVFFARFAEDARRVADIERSFVQAERGPTPMGPESFAHEMGRALGYPECCINAFVEAGPTATTHDLWIRAHGRSVAFRWPLNCLDPRSPFLLIPHIPCRFDCEPSLRMARSVLERVDRIFPGLRGTAERLLKRPVVLPIAGRPVSFPFQ